MILEDSTMEKTYQIITDSSCDLPQELADSLDLIVQPLQFVMEGKTYSNYLDGREIGFPEFFAKIRAGVTATTSAVNPESFREVMEPVLQKGLDVLFIGFSSGLSTTYQSGVIAAEDLREKYPERKIITIDSLCASLGQGLYVYLAAKKQQAGATIDELAAYLDEIKLHLCHWFTVTDLMHLKRGGRIPASTALLGTMLQIKPVMHMDNEGKLVSVGKAKGRRASLDAIAQKLHDTSVNPEEQTVFICHGDCREEAEYVAKKLKEESHVKEVIINYVGPVIGAHTGCGVVSVFFLGTER